MKNLLFVICFLSSLITKAQIPQVSLNLEWEIPFTFANQALTIEHDQLDRDYIYVAGKEAGLLIYDISGTPNKVKTITKNQFDTLDVMSVTQNGNFLYIALGNSFTNGQYSGMAIVDISTPNTAVITDLWKKTSGSKTGGGLVKVEGNYAYFGAMGNGLIIFDVTNKSDIIYKSAFIPDINYPDANPDPAKYNARGMAVKNDIVYLCYDAGGLRIIDASDKSNPTEIGKYSNPAMNGKPRAYNNIVLDDSLVYITVDYAGMEVLNIKNPANIKLVSWWNPWGTANWFASRGHSNEIQFDAASKLLFMSTGKSDINVVSVANPAQPDSVTMYGGINNNQGTWGLGLYKDKIYAGYIFVPLCIPFCSNWGGVKAISWNSITGTNEHKNDIQTMLYPNPNSGELTIQLNPNLTHNGTIDIYDLAGKKVYTSNFTATQKQVQLSLDQLSNGTYIVNVKSNASNTFSKLMLNR